MVVKIDKCFLWFECYIKGTYKDYLEINKYITLDKIYNIKDVSCLNKFNCKVIDKLYDRLINNTLKIKCNKEYNRLKNKGIQIVNIDSKYYPYDLRLINNPPLNIFCYGDISLLLNEKVYMYKESYFNKYGKDVYEYYLNIFKIKDYSYISDRFNKDVNIYITDKINIKRNNLLQISFYNINRIKEYLCYILDYIFIPQAKYDINLVNIVDVSLDINKEIYVVPNNVMYKEAYFSNYLLQSGANMILSSKDI